MPVPDEKEQKRIKNLLTELRQLPDDWKIFIASKQRNQIGYVKDGKETFDHPRLGPLPKGWIIRLVTNAETRIQEPRYENTATGKTYLKDPRIRDEVLKEHEETVRKHHSGDPKHSSLFSIAGSIRKTQKGENLSILKRAPITDTDISHHYEYLHVIDSGDADGIGGMNGGVFVVRMKKTGVLYVEKRFKEDIHDLAVNEIKLLRRLKHGALNFYISAYISPTKCAVWLEFCDRGSLKDLIKAYEKRRSEVPAGVEKPHMPEKWLWHCFIGLADALAYLRTGLYFVSNGITNWNEKDPNWVPVVHRDIKPDNVLLRSRTISAERKYFYVVLCDFGLAVEEYPPGDKRGNPQHFKGYLCGTGLWLAPELCGSPWQRREDNFPPGKRHSEKSDLWALGTTIYVMAECNEVSHVHTGRKEECPDQRTFDWRMSRRVLREDRETKMYYSEQLRESIKRAAAWDENFRPTPMRLVVEMVQAVKKVFPKDQEPSFKEQLPDWATRKHDYHSRDVIPPDKLFKKK